MSKETPNVVLITADQWRGDCLGCANVEDAPAPSPGEMGQRHRETAPSPTGTRRRMGRHPVMTPHLDQLAAEGARFTQAYADCPVCMPQRVTTLTGWTASHFGLPHNFSVRSPIGTPVGAGAEYAPSLPKRLSDEGGYQTKAIGKMHFVPDRARMGFEHITLHPNDYVIWLEDTPYAGMYRGHGLGGNEVYPAVAPMPERFTHTHWVVEQAIRFLTERDPECPFFLWLVFEAPHSPFDPPAPYDRMYDNFTIPDPVWGDWTEGDAYPPDFVERRFSHKYDYLSEEMIRESRRRYYGQISHIDYQLGRFLGELRTRGLYDSTALIFTADHGELLGDHGLFAKTTFLSGAARVPLIVKAPSGISLAHPALEIDSATMTADICPTILELAGLAPHDPMDGASLLPALARGEGDAGRVICGEYGGEHNLDHVTAFATDGVYKYLYYVNGGIEQLFDVRGDPDDLHNLAQTPELRDVRDRLRRALVDYLTKFDRPVVEDGDLIVRHVEIAEDALRGRNPAAWRGPMRYGQGYYG